MNPCREQILEFVCFLGAEERFEILPLRGCSGALARKADIVSGSKQKRVRKSSQKSDRLSSLGRGRASQPNDTLGGAFAFSVSQNGPNIAVQGWNVPEQEHVRSGVALQQTVDVPLVFPDQNFSLILIVSANSPTALVPRLPL